MEKMIASIREDLKNSGEQFVTSIVGYGLYAKVDVVGLLHRAREIVQEAYAMAGLQTTGTAAAQPSLTYAGLDPRDAAMLDILKFGPRTVDEIQTHCEDMGFTFERKGQIRSAINGSYNHRTYFNTSKSDGRISLRPAGLERAKQVEQKLLKRLRKSALRQGQIAAP